LEFSGAFEMSKIKILNQLNIKYRPASVLIKPDILPVMIPEILREKNLNFPLIAKPDIGERGKGVEKIENLVDLNLYLKTSNRAVILQEFIDYPLELGILYYKYPDGSGDEISSIVIREFLTITGDGKLTLEELIMRNQRALLRIAYLKKKFKNNLDQVIKNGEKINLEPIGNHNRGTKFLSGQHLINQSVLGAMRQVTADLEGFYYGRLDLKIKSLEELSRGVGIKVLEINGVNSEPAHIYDPGMHLLTAWRTIFKHMNIIYHISKQNRAKGSKPIGTLALLKGFRMHLNPNQHELSDKRSSKQIISLNLI